MEGKLWGVGFFAQGIDLKTLGRMSQTLRGYVVGILDSLSCWHKKLSSYSKNTVTCPICAGLSLEASYRRSSGGCESSSHRLLGHVCQQILQKYNS